MGSYATVLVSRLGNVPLLAALLVVVNPYLVWYSQEGKMYGWLVALALAALLAFLAALRHGQWWRWLASTWRCWPWPCCTTSGPSC